MDLTIDTFRKYAERKRCSKILKISKKYLQNCPFFSKQIQGSGKVFPLSILKYSHGENIIDKFANLSKKKFSMECFTTYFWQFFSAPFENCLLGDRLGTCYQSQAFQIFSWNLLISWGPKSWNLALLGRVKAIVFCSFFLVYEIHLPFFVQYTFFTSPFLHPQFSTYFPWVIEALKQSVGLLQ